MRCLTVLGYIPYKSDVKSQEMSWSYDSLETNFPGLDLGLALESSGIGLGHGLMSSCLGLGIGLLALEVFNNARHPRSCEF